MEQAMTPKPTQASKSPAQPDLAPAAAALEAALQDDPFDTSAEFQFLSIDPNERLPRPAPPRTKDTHKHISLVTWAISSKHENAPSESNNTNPNRQQLVIEAARNHADLCKLLTTKSSPAQLHGALHALLSSDAGRSFDRLLSSPPKTHAQLLHLLMRLDPFSPGAQCISSLEELEDIRSNRNGLLLHENDNNAGDSTTNSNSSETARVQINLESIEHKYIQPARMFLEYEVADVHLYLIVCCVGGNSLLGVSAVRAVWKLLTDFGTKWMNDQYEQKKKKKLLLRCNKDDDQCNPPPPPPAKRRKCQVDSNNDNADLPSIAENKEQETTPEGLKLVPGMNGLCVDFVKKHFFVNALHEEDICWDRLPRGRVKRLLLTLLNIFRLNHRSKNDLLHEMTTNFPHYKTSPPALHRWYILMCLQLVHSVPTLEGPVMNLLVDQALEMDVQIKINDRGRVFLDCDHHDDAEQQPVDDTITSSTKKRSYQIISHETILAVGKSNNNNNGEASPNDTSDEITEIAERLDNLMNLLCQRIHKLTSFSSDSISEALAAVVHARRLYRHLNDIFDKKVRNTHRSKFVPFILFVLFGREHDALEAVGKLMTVEEERKNHDGSPSNIVNVDAITAWKEDPKRKGEVNEVIAASISQTDFLYRDFCAKLIDLFYNPVEAGELPSQTLVCTLASFVSRATYVCSETVCETVAAILQWVEAYIEAHSESRSSTPSLMRRQSSGLLGNATFTMKHQREIHALFYTACQSAFYIMCFRGAEALHYYKAAWRQRDNPESGYASPESVNLGAKRWKAICQHPLQPLRYCLESVRVEFLYMAEDLHLFVEDSTGDDSINQQEEAKKFIQQLWSANDQKATGDKSKNTVTPKRKRSSIISTAATQEKKRIDGGVGGLGKGSNPLDSYFPFDPYLLQSSYKYVHPFYRNWEDCILTMQELNGDYGAEGSILNEEVVQDNGDNESDEDDGSALTDSADEQEDKDDDESDDDDEESKTKQSSQAANSKTLEGNGLEFEIRRCRALSTGSQASW